jgi:nicotinate-nucleotide pyrophosphorylase (carboxylating)
MLDNMSIQDMAEAVKIIGGRVTLEASGNVTLDNVRQIAETGVDMISIGALTHSVTAADISLKIVQ